MTTIVQRTGYKCILSCDPTGGTNFAALSAIVDGWDGPDCKPDEVDTSLLINNCKTSLPAQIDLGHVSLKINYAPEDTTTTTILSGLISSGVVANWQASFYAVGVGTIETKTWLGWVKGFKVVVKNKEMVQADIEIRVVGIPGTTTLSGTI